MPLPHTPANEPPTRPRGLEQNLRRWWSTAPVVILEGGRTTGKTTLCESLADSLGIVDSVDLSIESIRREAIDDPNGFVSSLRTPALIDEAQLAEQVTVAVKRVVDRSGKNGQFMLTGSSRIGRGALGGSDPLAGRAIRLQLRPFTLGERKGIPHNEVARWFDTEPERRFVSPVSRTEALRIATEGGIPTVPGVLPERSLQSGGDAHTDLARLHYLDAYVEAVLHLAVAESRSDRSQMRLALRYLAANPGQILVNSRAASELGINVETLRSYIDQLESSFLLWRADAQRPQEHRSPTSHPRLYPADTGLAGWALHRTIPSFPISPGNAGFSSSTEGSLVEALVANECAAQGSWCLDPIGVRHWRDTKAKMEVDLVLVDGAGRMVGVEVKAAGAVRGEDARGLRRMATQYGDRFLRGIVVYTGDRVFPLDEGIWAVPISCLLGSADD